MNRLTALILIACALALGCSSTPPADAELRTTIVHVEGMT